MRNPVDGVLVETDDECGDLPLKRLRTDAATSQIAVDFPSADELARSESRLTSQDRSPYVQSISPVVSKPPQPAKRKFVSSSAGGAVRLDRSPATDLFSSDGAHAQAFRSITPNTSAAGLTESSLPCWPYTDVDVAKHLGFDLNKGGVETWKKWTESIIVAPHYQALQKRYQKHLPYGTDPRQTFDLLTQLSRKKGRFDNNDKWLLSSPLSRAVPAGLPRRKLTRASWVIAATLYRIYADNRRAWSPASIVERGGTPRWYALWALIRYLKGQHRGPSSNEEHKQANKEGQVPTSDKGGLSKTDMGTGDGAEQVPSLERSTRASCAFDSAARVLGTTPVTKASSTTDLNVTLKITNASHSNDITSYALDPSGHSEPKSRSPVQDMMFVQTSSPSLSSNKEGLNDQGTRESHADTARIVRKPTPHFPLPEAQVSKTPTSMDPLNRMQDHIALKVNQAEAAEKSAQDQLRESSRHLKKAKENAQALQSRAKMAQKELEIAEGWQAILKTTKEEHTSTAQRYRDSQKDLEQLARMHEVQAEGLRALNVPSSETILAASLDLMVKGVVDKYQDILADENLAAERAHLDSCD